MLIWLGLAFAIAVPMVVAAQSPLLEWRDAIYIGAGFAGIAALGLLLFQPLLAAGLLPGLPPRPGRQVHRWLGGALIALVLAHVVGLFITSPPDAIDALLLNSPTPFSIWGVAAMWAAFGAAVLAGLRGPLRLDPRLWRIGHTALTIIVVIGTIIHALYVEGPMGPISKAVLCALVFGATAIAVWQLRAWTLLRRRRERN